jgi:hypothetical protein
MIDMYMSRPYETKKYSADKVAFLALFILALLIARFIIASRSAIVLSKPIKLDYAGLSAVVPAGRGWRSEKQWKYQENAFTLSSVFKSGSGTALARCRYLLLVTKASSDVLFEQKASEVGGVIAKAGQTPISKPGSAFAESSQSGSPVVIDWVQIIKPQTLSDMFFGIAQLPNNRRLDVEVYQTTGDIDLTEHVFELMVESLEFEDNPFWEAGIEVVAEIKNKGLDHFLVSHYPAGPQNTVRSDKQSRESFFLIKDAGGHSIGFTMEVLIRAASLQNDLKAEPVGSAPNTQLSIQGASFNYLRGLYDREQSSFFQSDNSFDEFAWKSRTSSIDGISGTEIFLGEDDIMTVKEFGTRPREKVYRIGPAAIPDVLSELVFGPLLDSGHEKIFVDIIQAEGTILPIFISKAERKDFAAEKDVASVFTVEFLDGQGFSEWLYLDEQRRISKRLLRRGRIYLLERSSAEDIADEFSERADPILNFPFYQLQDDF